MHSSGLSPVRVVSPSRLHFGLLNLRGVAEVGQGVSPRSFGGVGLMIDQPGVALTFEPAADWSAVGTVAERTLTFARKFAEATPELAGLAGKFTVTAAPPEHVGLGTGTQLGLAVAKALAASRGLDLDHLELAKRVGRGERSALGIHGFARGGFLVDGGKGPNTHVAPLVAHAPFPADWRIVLVIPHGIAGLHGSAERRAFADSKKLAASPDSLCRLVLLSLLPALAEKDLPAFAAALYEFNRRVGEMFRPWQGGIYAHPRTQSIVDLIRKRSVGVGQSSWGPSVFAVTDADSARQLAEDLRHRLPKGDTILITAAANRGCDVVCLQNVGQVS